jgi:hypothetical protein
MFVAISGKLMLLDFDYARVLKNLICSTEKIRNSHHDSDCRMEFEGNVFVDIHQW